ncbi:MAG: hypothetical protein HY735_01550 [Verrucomicrobia bacterium]|nr:hypothetical protein [Verrucomicrobiota bacterium]
MGSIQATAEAEAHSTAIALSLVDSAVTKVPLLKLKAVWVEALTVQRLLAAVSPMLVLVELSAADILRLGVRHELILAAQATVELPCQDEVFPTLGQKKI